MTKRPCKKIPKTFTALLTPTGVAGLLEAVEATPGDWWETAASIFDLGLVEWGRQQEARVLAETEAEAADATE